MKKVLFNLCAELEAGISRNVCFPIYASLCFLKRSTVLQGLSVLGYCAYVFAQGAFSAVLKL